MNFRSILRAIFKGQPTLQEFIEAHQPVDTYQVEYLEKEYDRVYGFSYPMGR